MTKVSVENVERAIAIARKLQVMFNVIASNRLHEEIKQHDAKPIEDTEEARNVHAAWVHGLFRGAEAFTIKIDQLNLADILECFSDKQNTIHESGKK